MILPETIISEIVSTGNKKHLYVNFDFITFTFEIETLSHLSVRLNFQVLQYSLALQKLS